MSAYIVSNNHINAILRFADLHCSSVVGGFARQHMKMPAAGEYLTKIGQILLRENVRSVNYRYREKTRPGKFEYDQDAPAVSHIEALKLVNCLDYQSCERKDWHKSPACILLAEIKMKILEDLAGLNHPSGQKQIQISYNDAPWSI